MAVVGASKPRFKKASPARHRVSFRHTRCFVCRLGSFKARFPLSESSRQFAKGFFVSCALEPDQRTP